MRLVGMLLSTPCVHVSDPTRPVERAVFQFGKTGASANEMRGEHVLESTYWGVTGDTNIGLVPERTRWRKRISHMELCFALLFKMVLFVFVYL